MTLHFNTPIKANEDKADPFAGLPVGDPTIAQEYFNDFFSYAAADWVITTTEAGTSAATETIVQAGQGGLFQIYNDNADNDADAFQQSSDGGTTVGEFYKLASGRPLGFSTRFKVSDATQSDLMIGLYITDTSPIAGVTDGLYFRKDDASTTLSLISEKNSTETALTVATMANDTFVEVGYRWDGKNLITAYQRTSANYDKWTKIGTISTNICDDEELALSFVWQNGEAAAGKTMTIDYIKVVQERNA